jgi:hypothetical protein
MSTAVPSCRRPFSPLASWQQVQPRESQTFLRQAFARWGRPERLRVDNGTPWGASDGLPTGLVLWLAGLAVPVDHNPACRPQDNGVVERSQGTGKKWAEPSQCNNVAQLQRGLDEADRRQREQYPYRQGQSRLAILPSLKHSGRRYSLAWEQRHWCWDLVGELLAGVVVSRRVDKAGCVSLYSRNCYVGKTWAGQQVWVRYDPQGQRWTMSDEQNRLLAYREAPELSHERIVNLTATDGRSKRK